MTATALSVVNRRLVEVRDLETNATLTKLHGRAVPYGKQTDVGFYLEEHEAGSFAKSIKEAARALPLTLFHDDRSFPIGSASEWDDNGEGLDGTWDLADHEEAQRAAKLAKDGHLTGLSIEFQPIRSAWTFVEDWNPDLGAAGKDSVVRQESRLIATSLVQMGAYVDAATKWVRSADGRRRTGPSEAEGWLEWVRSVRGA